MAMATQASLFTPALAAPKSGVDRVIAPWKQSVSSLAFAATPKAAKSSPRTAIRAAAAEGKAEAPAKVEAPVGFTPPELDPTTPSPIFGGSTGGLLRKAQVKIVATNSFSDIDIMALLDSRRVCIYIVNLIIESINFILKCPFH